MWKTLPKDTEAEIDKTTQFVKFETEYKQLICQNTTISQKQKHNIKESSNQILKSENFRNKYTLLPDKSLQLESSNNENELSNNATNSKSELKPGNHFTVTTARNDNDIIKTL